MRRISQLEIWCSESLKEVGLDYTNLSFDALKGTFCSKALGKKPMLMPSRLWKQIQFLPKNKSENFTFSGQLYENRKWVLDYPNVNNTNIGRNLDLRYNGFDSNYYISMCQSKFTLCPVGLEPWSHRFLEAIACYSIPVIGPRDIDILAGNWFKYYRHPNVKEYKIEWAEHNYNEFLKKHTLYYQYFV
jgi:hypothetical protein